MDEIYRVHGSLQRFYSVDVTAKDEDSAREKAKDIDVKKWDSDDDGDFEIQRVEKLEMMEW